jgi:hypothetical protein
VCKIVVFMPSEIADIQPPACADATGDEALERRVVRSMCAAVALAVMLSALVAPWRVTTGLLLGGALSLFNHHWLRSSIAAMFRADATHPRERLGVSRFVVRYFVIACVVAVAVALNVVSVVASLAGMCSFVVALFVEASLQFYTVIVKREET